MRLLAAARRRLPPGDARRRMVLDRIISGGQTGADRGGLDAALALGIPHGGWCPRGRRAEDGRIPARYRLSETESEAYHVRTRRNVRAADGTVLFTRGLPTGGSRLTAEAARASGLPLLQLDPRALDTHPDQARRVFRRWLAKHRIRTLNVAGSRESTTPGMRAAVERFLVAALSARPLPLPVGQPGAEPEAPVALLAEPSAPQGEAKAWSRSPPASPAGPGCRTARHGKT